MVRLYTDEQMDEKCKDFRPVPLKLYRVVYGLEGKGTNPLTTTKSDRMMSLPSANINLATKSNIPLNPVPASMVKLRYNQLYENVIVDGKKLNTEIDIEKPVLTSAPVIDPEEERPPPNEVPETTGSESVISTVIDPTTGEIEELMETPETTPERSTKDIPKPQARKGVVVMNGRGVKGTQYQTDPNKKGQKIIM